MRLAAGSARRRRRRARAISDSAGARRLDGVAYHGWGWCDDDVTVRVIARAIVRVIIAAEHDVLRVAALVAAAVAGGHGVHPRCAGERDVTAVAGFVIESERGARLFADAKQSAPRAGSYASDSSALNSRMMCSFPTVLSALCAQFTRTCARGDEGRDE